MLFVTNRALNEGPTTYREDGSVNVPRSVSFNLQNNQAEQSVYFCRRNTPGDYTEVGSTVFFSELKASSYEQILLYIHGFNNLPEPSIFPRVDSLQRLFDAPNAILNGKVLVVPLIWPCDNDLGLVDDYFDDQIAADASAYAFTRMFEKFLHWRIAGSTLKDPCIKRINILAHSMGNRVLRGTLELAVRYFRPDGAPMIFRNIFMAAADVVNETLEPGQRGQYITDAARNVVVYYAADDLAMRASKVANISTTSRRLGHTGPQKIDRVSNNVYAFDCSDFNNDYQDRLGHTYFDRDRNNSPGLLFDHMSQCIATGRIPLENIAIRQQILNTRFWRS
jgi:esterase/lipase superfamily enzyme